MFDVYVDWFLKLAQIVTILYAAYKFTRKPHDSLDSRLTAVEVKLAEHEQSLHQGNDRFKQQDDTNEILTRCTFALLEFEVHYCETEQKPISKNLERAKDDLHDYLASK